jgi:hypothetical protein
MRKLTSILIVLVSLIYLISFTSCKKDCEELAPSDIQTHLDDIEGKWTINSRSSIFDAEGWSCTWQKDTAYLSTNNFGFDVLLIATVGTDCRFLDSTIVEDIHVLAQHDGRYVYQPPNSSMDYHFDVEIIEDTIHYNPPDILIEEKLIGFVRNNIPFELVRSVR